MAASVKVGSTVRWTAGPVESGFDPIEVVSEGALKGRKGWAVRGCPGSVPRFGSSNDTKEELLLCNPAGNRSVATATDLGVMTDSPASLRALEDLEPFDGAHWYSFRVVDAGFGGNPVDLR